MRAVERRLNKSRRREREVPFYATRKRRRKKREAREHAHVHENARAGPASVCVHACARERCTVFAPGGNARTCRRNRESSDERQRRREKGGSEGDGSCVCTTRRVYQATSVVTAIVPTTSPAGRHPRSILSVFLSVAPSLIFDVRSDFLSSFPWSPWHFLLRRGAILSPYPPRAFLVPLPEISRLASFLFPIFGAISVFTSGRRVNF